MDPYDDEPDIDDYDDLDQYDKDYDQWMENTISIGPLLVLHMMTLENRTNGGK